jgi:Rieske Fe-S protein
MSDDPQSRFERDLDLDTRVDSPQREGLAGSAAGDLYQGRRDAEAITLAPDGRPAEDQPRWRRDFSIDWPQDHLVARRDFAKFLVLISGSFAAGQGWIAVQSLTRKRQPPPERARIAALAEVAPGTVTTFAYPGEHDPCLLIRTADGELYAYSQKCTHLSCAVIPRLAEGVIHCPCHEGYFDLYTGRNIAGPPPRPLPAIELEVVDGQIYATAVMARTV